MSLLRIQQLVFCMIALVFLTGCSKVEYRKVDSPAYLRVFNDLNYVQSLDTKDQEVPFLAMLIDPVMDQDGMPVSTAILGDFLDQRAPYAPPYPSHIGNSTSVNNPEYPGKEDVLIGPVLNGFDLSSWAQIPSGSHRIVFMFRPKNTIPFFSLESRLKTKVLIDTTMVLDAQEVYTLHVLQKDYVTKKNGVFLRQENFHKLPLSDSLVYVNFYNLSAKGFWEADNVEKGGNNFAKGAMGNGIRDKVNVFYTLYRKNDAKSPVANFTGNYLGEVRRTTGELAPSPYYSFPLFADPLSDGIYTDVWQRLDVMAPGMDPANKPYGLTDLNTDNNWAPVSFFSNGTVAPAIPNESNNVTLPNMIVNIHSGNYNPRSFATVNTIEFVNGNVYLTTVQRKYAPPIYK
ncbi:hypothetical protein ACSBL2_25710 [Pedobacter sp. AW31-3R]|uniref:hypothetical protein n=1 Tax=Pedobacter sp. AW31-3R TaxID=3445781 RepID=UPI003F9ECD59